MEKGAEEKHSVAALDVGTAVIHLVHRGIAYMVLCHISGRTFHLAAIYLHRGSLYDARHQFAVNHAGWGFNNAFLCLGETQSAGANAADKEKSSFVIHAAKVRFFSILVYKRVVCSIWKCDFLIETAFFFLSKEKIRPKVSL